MDRSAKYELSPMDQVNKRGAPSLVPLNLQKVCWRAVTALPLYSLMDRIEFESLANESIFLILANREQEIGSEFILSCSASILQDGFTFEYRNGISG